MTDDPRYAWMNDPNGRGIAYINRVLHTKGIYLSDEEKVMLLVEFHAVEDRIRLEEREECAKVAEQKVQRVSFVKPGGEVDVYKWNDGPEIAAAIRARGS